jgi:hypothetical protein
MKNKKCFKCGKVKRIDLFYKHSEMKDGYLNKCKECNKQDVSENYRKNIEHYIKYEKERWRDPKRKLKVLEYQRKRRMAYPGKRKARYKINNAIRNGTIKIQPCSICGKAKVEAHHEDYRKPLNVIWFCRKHHLERHKKIERLHIF